MRGRVFSAGWYTFVGRWDAKNGERFFDEASPFTAIAYTRGGADEYYSYFFRRMVSVMEMAEAVQRIQQAREEAD